MSEDYKTYPNRQSVWRIWVTALLILLSIPFLNSCGLIDDSEGSFPVTTLDNEERDEQNIVNEEEDQPMLYEDDEQDMVHEEGEQTTECEDDEQDVDYGEYDYWSELLKTEKEDLDFLIGWLTKNDYFTSLAIISNDDIYVEPAKKSIEEKIQSDEEFDRIKEFLYKNDIWIDHYWASIRNISLVHDFWIGEQLTGSYILVYTEDKIRDPDTGKEVEVNEPYYRKVSENLYSNFSIYE